MILPSEFFNILKKYDFSFFSGVPDSTFENWISFLIKNDGTLLTHTITCNECESIAMCAGYYLATGKNGVAYMQNSGFGKAINPLASLCDPEIFSIPVLLIIGWRGEPKKQDAPQHKKMGRIMNLLLDDLEIPYSILTSDINEIEREVKKAKEYLEGKSGPYALIIKKGLFKEPAEKVQKELKYELTRELAISLIIKNLKESDIIVSTTGKTSRELHEYRQERNEIDGRDFYMVGSMGCAPSIGLSIALQKRERKVYIFDGDGAILMQLGALSTIGQKSPSNLTHIIFDNESHQSTGGQPTASPVINLREIALNCNYKYAALIKSKQELQDELEKIDELEGPLMLIIKVNQKSRIDLGRPKTSLCELKNNFMKFLKRDD